MHSRAIAILFTIVTSPASPASWQVDRDQAARQHTAGNYREAERLFRSALRALTETAPRDSHIPAILNDLGAECHLLGRYDEAQQFYLDALSSWRSQRKPPADAVARGLANLATTYRTRGLYREAEAAYTQALQSLEGDPRYAAQYAFTLSNLADLYRVEQKLAEALPPAERAVKMLDAIGAIAAPRLAFALQTLATIERANGHLDQAERCSRRGLDLTIAQHGDNHPDTAAAKNNLADIALKRGHYGEAERLAREAMTTWERTLGSTHSRVGVAAVNLAQALRFQHRFDESAAQYERALAVLKDADRARCLTNFADLNQQLGKPVAAVDLYRQALENAQQSLGPDHPETALIMTRLAEVRRSQGMYRESVKLYRRALLVLEAAGPAEAEELRTARRNYNETLKESARTMLLKLAL